MKKLFFDMVENWGFLRTIFAFLILGIALFCSFLNAIVSDPAGMWEQLFGSDVHTQEAGTDWWGFLAKFFIVTCVAVWSWYCVDLYRKKRLKGVEMSAILDKAPQLVLLAFGVGGVLSVLVTVAASLFGKTLDPNAFELVKTMLTVGVSVVGGAGLNSIATKAQNRNQ